MGNENLNNGRVVLLHVMVDNNLSEDEAIDRAVRILMRYTPLDDHSFIEQWARDRSEKFLIKFGEIVHQEGVEEILDEAAGEQ